MSVFVRRNRERLYAWYHNKQVFITQASLASSIKFSLFWISLHTAPFKSKRFFSPIDASFLGQVTAPPRACLLSVCYQLIWQSLYWITGRFVSMLVTPCSRHRGARFSITLFIIRVIPPFSVALVLGQNLMLSCWLFLRPSAPITDACSTHGILSLMILNALHSSAFVYYSLARHRRQIRNQIN